MQRISLGVAALVAIVAAWLYPLKETLDFGFDATFSRQILAGLNPYDHGVVPRPPSAWLLQLPVAWVDTALLSRTAGAASILAVSWLAIRLLKVHAMWLPVAVGFVALTHMPRVAVSSGNMSSVIALLFVWAWVRRSGFAVGVAASLRIYPIVWLFAVRRWSAVWTVAAFGVAGLLLVPDLGLGDLVESGTVFTRHAGNGSAVRFLGLPATLALGGLIAWQATRVGFDQAMCLVACAAVLTPAIAWQGYHLILVPVVAWALAAGRWWVLAAIPYWLTDGSLLLAPDLGTAMFLSTLIVAASVAVPSWSAQDETSGNERIATPLAMGDGDETEPPTQAK